MNTLSGDSYSAQWYTCGDRIAYLQSSAGGSLTLEAAMVDVSLTFTQCQACWPWPKYKALGDKRRSAKRGIAIQNHKLSPQALAAVATTASWGYVWDFSPDYTWPVGGPTMAEWNAAGVRFVPMVWGENHIGLAQQKGLPAGRRALLGFNEPNFPEQAALSPQRAAELWPQVQALAARRGIDYLVSPAVNFHSGYGPVAWLRDFLRLCVGCRVDAIAFHTYTCHGRYLRDHIDMYRVFGKKLWLTEFACAEAGRLSAEGQMAYMREAIPLLEHDADIEAYAWFSYFQDEWAFSTGDVNGDAGLVRADGSLSALGQLYSSFAATAYEPPAPEPQPATASTTTTAPTTVTTTLPRPSLPTPAVCHTAVPGEACYNEVRWAMHDGVAGNPAWYPGLSTSSSFDEFQMFLHLRDHLEGVCPEPCQVCHTTISGERCHDNVTWVMQQDLGLRPELYPGLSAASTVEEVQAFLHRHRTGRADAGCPRPCSAPLPAEVRVEYCHEALGGCSSVGVNIFGADGFESREAMKRAIGSLFANGVRHFRVVNAGGWQDSVLAAIDEAAGSFGVAERVSLQVTSMFFESPTTCPSLPPWMDFSLAATARKLQRLKNIGRVLVQLDTCSICTTSALYCTNPTEQAFAQDLRFGSTEVANRVADFIADSGPNGYGPAHVVAAHRALPRHVEFVIPYMNSVQSPHAMVRRLAGAYAAPLRRQGRRFHLEATFYPFWTGSGTDFAPFPGAQVRAASSVALPLGFDGFVVAETGWPETCPGAQAAEARSRAGLARKCRYLASALQEAEHLARAGAANGDGGLLTYLWKFGPADDGSGCGRTGFGLFRQDGSFACAGLLRGWS